MTKTRKYFIAYTIFAVTAMSLMIIALVFTKNPRPSSMIAPMVALLPAYIVLTQRLKKEKEQKA